MPLLKIKSLVALLLVVLVGACSNTPNHLIIAPDILTTPNLQYSDKETQLEITDMRTANHIVQILQEGEAATLISAQERLENTIKQTLTTQWQKQGLKVTSSADNTINISIEKAIISVSQQTMNYQSQTEIILKVTINKGLQTQTSTFKNRGNSKGPFQADIAVLERNFNRRLTSLIENILNHKKMNSFLLK